MSGPFFYIKIRLISQFKKVQIKEVQKNGVQFTSYGEPLILKNIDTVVIAENMVPVREAMNIIKNNQNKSKKIKLLTIGDAKKPRNLMLALSEAEEAIATLNS